MSLNWFQDIHNMQAHYGFHEKYAEFDDEKKRKFLEFRIKFLQEELDEMRDGINNPEDVVDALIDLCVVAIGTLDAYQIDAHKAWDAVLKANMSKVVGIKESRPNALNLPDLIKPLEWQGPSHEGNHGTLPR